MANRNWDRVYDRGQYSESYDDREGYYGRSEQDRDRTDRSFAESSYGDRDTSTHSSRNSNYNPPNYGSARSDYGRNAYGGSLNRQGLDRDRYSYNEGRYGYPEGRYYTTDEPYRYGHDRDRGQRYSDDRGFWDRATDEVRSWFGDEEAERRRRQDERVGPHRGRGPKGYQRSNERITEDLNERLWEHSYIDANDIEVSAKDGEVTLSGTVSSRYEKRLAEDLAYSVSGVKDVHNHLRVSHSTHTDAGESLTSSTQTKARATSA